MNIKSEHQDINDFIKSLYEKYGDTKGLYFPKMGDSNKKDKTSAKIHGAVNKYAHIAKDELVIALNDASITGDGEKGFLLTTRKIYTRFPNDESGYIAFDTIESIDLVSKGMFSNDHNIVINAGKEHELPVWRNFCDEKTAYQLITDVVNHFK